MVAKPTTDVGTQAFLRPDSNRDALVVPLGAPAVLRTPYRNQMSPFRLAHGCSYFNDSGQRTGATVFQHAIELLSPGSLRRDGSASESLCSFRFLNVLFRGFHQLAILNIINGFYLRPSRPKCQVRDHLTETPVRVESTHFP
jgi:hypothetical protein